MRNHILVLCLFLYSAMGGAEELPPPPNYKAYLHQQTLKQQYQAYLAYKQQAYQRSLSFKSKQQQKPPHFFKTPTSPLPNLFQNEAEEKPLQKQFKSLSSNDLNRFPLDEQPQSFKNKLPIQKKPIKQEQPQTGEAQFRPLNVPFTP